MGYNQSKCKFTFLFFKTRVLQYRPGCLGAHKDPPPECCAPNLAPVRLLFKFLLAVHNNRFHCDIFMHRGFWSHSPHDPPTPPPAGPLFPAILLSVCVCMSLGIVTEIQEKGCLQAHGHLASGYITEENVFPSPSNH